MASINRSDQDADGAVALLVETAGKRLRQCSVDLADATKQREALDERIRRLRGESTKLRAILDEYRGASSSAASPVPLDDKRRSLADEVVELLRELGRPLHYRDIEEALRSRGKYHGGGKDPANALLATYFNDQRLERPSRGTYAFSGLGRQRAVRVGTRRNTPRQP
ncbi:MAG: hypothetical protein ACR2HN_02060 [Tepidiformaceae bacterium]